MPQLIIPERTIIERIFIMNKQFWSSRHRLESDNTSDVTIQWMPVITKSVQYWWTLFSDQLRLPRVWMKTVIELVTKSGTVWVCGSHVAGYIKNFALIIIINVIMIVDEYFVGTCLPVTVIRIILSDSIIKCNNSVLCKKTMR